jgi:predicted SAM-dependent methyltransferase
MVDLGSPPVRVNIGSGLAAAPGWIHVDAGLNVFLAPAPPALLRLAYRRTRRAQASYTEDQYVGTLKGHHFVHHRIDFGLPFADRVVDYLYASHVLEHFSRAGAVRLAREAWRVLRPGGVFRVVVPDLDHVTALLNAGETRQALALLYTDEGDRYSQHQSMFNFAELRDLLEIAGFQAVVRCAYREGRTPDLMFLDNRPDESMYVEATA